MEIKSETVEGFRCIILKGQLDIEGTREIDLKFTTMTSTHQEPVMVDLSEVDFISSIGIRLLLTNARALLSRGVKMVLVNPMHNVAKVLRTSGMDQILPVVETTLAAAAILKGTPKE